MTKYQERTLNAIRHAVSHERAVVLVHGFSGDQDDTWDRFPGLLGAAVTDWDIYTLGYPTTFRPDFLGVWSADPDIPILATKLKTEAGIDPLRQYGSLALVAHSMGGLIVQRALLDDPTLADRTEKVILFGTPSAGLRKASWLIFWKRQLKNMAKCSDFITALRRDWAERFEPQPGFDFRVVAGDEDQFVPSSSSLEPFPVQFRHVVSGDHSSMVRPADAESQSVRFLVSALADTPMTDELTAPLTLAAELPDSSASDLIKGRGGDMSEDDVVRAALALEHNGRRDEATALLQRYQELGTDVQGTLAGRIKRMWMENEDIGFAQHALALYQSALAVALRNRDRGQIHYHSINVAFLEFVAFNRVERAREVAKLAFKNAALAEEDVWSVATQAEASLYLNQTEVALHLYHRMFEFEAEPWQHASTGLQAGQIASRLGDRQLADKLEKIFTPTT